tara:strand:- start:10888 stop:11121 length:234 start_codon:yes stop_codon:yes gene_type:complete
VNKTNDTKRKQRLRQWNTNFDDGRNNAGNPVDRVGVSVRKTWWATVSNYLRAIFLETGLETPCQFPCRNAICVVTSG